MTGTHRMTNASSIATVVFFWDYDTQWGGDRSRSVGGPKSWGPLEFLNTDVLLELHARYSMPACFAVVGAAALPGNRPYHDPRQIRRIHEAGNEVGSHSLHHDWLPQLTGTALRATLRESRDLLEQCTGDRVITFVPPWNQPFDYPLGWSFSLAERREVSKGRSNLGDLCAALAETGYKFCRVAYRPIWLNLVERFSGRRMDSPASLETIRGVSCVRLNTPDGFDEPARKMLHRCAKEGGIVVLHGHPHSLRSSNSQDERHLIPLMEEISRLRETGKARVLLPRDLLIEGGQG